MDNSNMHRGTYVHRFLVIYDILVFLLSGFIILYLYSGDSSNLSLLDAFYQGFLALSLIILSRSVGKIYRQVWRYGGVSCYIRLIVCDSIAFIFYLFIERLLPIHHITFSRKVALVCVNLLGSLTIRLFYRYCYMYSEKDTPYGQFVKRLLNIFAGISSNTTKPVNKIKIAIIGAGKVGVSLVEDLFNSYDNYEPRLFIDISKDKIGREIHGISVIGEDENLVKKLNDYEIQEVVLAIPNMDLETRKATYNKYKSLGYKIKVYDYPTLYSSTKRHLRDFDVDELLFRKPIDIENEECKNFYKDKVVLITGGGGSIGSELARQLAKMDSKQIIILDIYENGAYSLEQELKIAYKDKVNLSIEICSVTNKDALRKVFETYKPNIVIHAAAHKHVPLMEHNIIEAVENNVFGTKNVLNLCEEYKTDRFMMVSTDKAVNPTNVMGATKRMCEMLVNNCSTHGIVKCSSTRFGNVLGSAGSVIPLFKQQIAAGGPVTLTDKRIIRYFMTIPEASQLVLQSGAMAHNGELFVLDMGEPVKILDLAESMIKLSGANDIEIVETGLRPGEKLYEELLIKTEDLDKTSNKLIFIETDKPLNDKEIKDKLDSLTKAINTKDDLKAKEALHEVIPTYIENKVN